MEAVTSEQEKLIKELQDKTNEYSKVCMEMGHEIALRANLRKSILLKEELAIKLNEQCGVLKAELDKLTTAPSVTA